MSPWSSPVSRHVKTPSLALGELQSVPQQTQDLADWIYWNRLTTPRVKPHHIPSLSMILANPCSNSHWYQNLHVCDCDSKLLGYWQWFCSWRSLLRSTFLNWFPKVFCSCDLCDLRNPMGPMGPHVPSVVECTQQRCIPWSGVSTVGQWRSVSSMRTCLHLWLCEAYLV